MLKLINSSYRSLWLIVENLYPCTVRVKKNFHVYHRREICDKESPSVTHPFVNSCKPPIHLRRPLFVRTDQLNFNYRNKQNFHEAFNTVYKQMTNFIPANCNNSDGNYVDLPSTDSDEEWQRGSDDMQKSDMNNCHRCSVPSNFRIWEPVTKWKASSDGANCRFTLVSYNVLAQYLLECHPYLYTGCSPRNLKWKRRSKLLYNEIMSLSPDILCLQEVQATHLNTFFSKFEEIGYTGIFKQKTGQRYDGCAIYFKQSLFEMIDHLNVEFFQPELPILNRDNIGLMVKLVPRSEPSLPFVVATTHLLYNPKRTDVRLAQIKLFLAEIDRFAYDSTGRESEHLPIILTGDLNSTPDSAVIQLLDNGHVSAIPFRDSSDWKKIGVTDNCQHLAVHINQQNGQNLTDFSMIKIYNSDYSQIASKINGADDSFEREHDKMFNSGVIGHSLKLKSVYNKVKNDGQHEATTFQDYWVTVDYIYFSHHSRLNVLERLRLPTANECEVLGQLPNEVYGSDHLAISAIFELKSLKCSL